MIPTTLLLLLSVAGAQMAAGSSLHRRSSGHMEHARVAVEKRQVPTGTGEVNVPSQTAQIPDATTMNTPAPVFTPPTQAPTFEQTTNQVEPTTQRPEIPTFSSISEITSVNFNTNLLTNIRTSTTSTSSTSTRLVTTAPTISHLNTRTTISRETTTAADATSTDDGGGFLKNKTALAATFTAVGIAAMAALLVALFYLRRKMRKDKEDNWETGSMTEFAMPGDYRGGDMSPPTLPPPSGYGASRSGHGHEDDVDEMLAMPPVQNYERPRDSAFDIVPAPPPAHAISSGYTYPSAYSRRPYDPSTPRTPHLGTPTSDPDPFSATAFVNATRQTGNGPSTRGYNKPSTQAMNYDNGYDAASGYAMAPYQGGGGGGYGHQYGGNYNYGS